MLRGKSLDGTRVPLAAQALYGGCFCRSGSALVNKPYVDSDEIGFARRRVLCRVTLRVSGKFAWGSP